MNHVAESVLAVAVASLLCTGASTAASPEQSRSAETVPPQLEDSEGYRAGSFFIRPALDVSGIYDSNIFATRNDEISDTIMLYTPTIEANSDWSQHEVNFDAGGALGRYSSYSSENYDDYWANIEGRFDLRKSSNIFGGFEFAHEHEERGSPDQLVSGAKPTTFNSRRAHLGLSHAWGKFRLRTGGTHEKLDYDDSSPINNDDRDRALSGLGSRLYYEINDQYRLYLQGTFDKRNYESTSDDFGFDRDSKGYRTGVGLEGTVSNQLKADIYIGYLHQRYDDPAFSNANKPDFGATLRWRAAPRTIMTAELARSLEETTLPGSPGYLYTSLGGIIRHKLAPRINVNAGLSVAKADYLESDRDDVYYRAFIGGRYYLSPQWFLGAEYRLLSRDSSDRAFNPPDNRANPQSFSDYARNQFFLTVGASLYPVKAGPAWNASSGEALEISSGDWSGLYAGAQLGQDTLNLRTQGGRDEGTDRGEYSSSGASGGLFAGYGLSWQRWYAGLEIDYEDSSNGISHTKAKDSSRSLHVDTGRSFGLAFRLGHRIPTGPLLYGRLGAVDTKFHSRFSVNGQPDGAENNTHSLSGTRFGVGADIPVGEHLFVRLDYSYSNYNNYSARIRDLENNAQSERFDPRGGLFRLGLGWSAKRHQHPASNHKVDYTGLYAGAQLGHGSIQSNARGTHQDGGRPGETFDFRGEFGKDSGFTGGVILGYGLNRGRFHMALEGALTDSNAEWKHERKPRGRDFSIEKMDTQGISVRAGYILNNGVLLYGRIGKVKTRFNTRWNKGENRAKDVDRDDRVSGNQIGVGTELPITRRIFLRLDYSYTDYDGYRFSTSHANADTMRFDNKETLFSTGLTVRF